jgi:hypothetical protein
VVDNEFLNENSCGSQIVFHGLFRFVVSVSKRHIATRHENHDEVPFIGLSRHLYLNMQQPVPWWLHEEI